MTETIANNNDSQIDRERILNKVKRCLALSKSSNEHEASTALRQAHAMMEKYRLSMDDIQMSIVNEYTSDTKIAQRPNLYKVRLANLIAKKFSCKIYSTVGYEEEIDDFSRKVCFVGMDIYPQIASYAYDVLVRQLENSRRQYMREKLSRVRIKQNKYQRADAYCHGWVSTVSKLIDSLVPPEVEYKLIENKIRSLSLNKAKSPIDRVKKIDSKLVNDFWNGKEDGKKAELHNAMNGTDQYARIEVFA